MHRAAVVPDHEVADGPALPVDELRLGGEGDELFDQRPPLLHRPADDVRGVRGEVEAGAPRIAVVTDQRLPRRRQFREDRVIEIGKADLAARAVDAVLDNETVELTFARLRRPGRRGRCCDTLFAAPSLPRRYAPSPSLI